MTTPSKVDHLLDVPVRLEAVLKGPVLRISELLALSQNSVINTGQPAGETVEVFAAGSLIGSAELTDANGRRAVRIVRFYAGSH